MTTTNRPHGKYFWKRIFYKTSQLQTLTPCDLLIKEVGRQMSFVTSVSKGICFLKVSSFLQHAQERSEIENLREKVKSLQEKLKQERKKSADLDGPGTEKPVVEEVIREDRVGRRVSHRSYSMQILSDLFVNKEIL